MPTDRNRNKKIAALDAAMDEATIASGGFLGGRDVLEALEAAGWILARSNARKPTRQPVEKQPEGHLCCDDRNPCPEHLAWIQAHGRES